MSDRLDTALRAHYSDAALPAATRDKLLDLAELGDRARQRPTRRWVTLAVASAAVALVAGGSLLGGDSKIDDSVAEDIALNHRKHLAVEFASADYGELDARMAKLDFALAEPGLEMALVGGRYCSVKGELAAQLKIRGADGRIHTLYQTRWRDEFGPLDQRQIDIDGIAVTTWRRGELLMGIASD